MSDHPKYPALYQVNTRVYLTELSRQLARAATLDDIPDRELDRWSQTGFDWVWLLSVWQTSETSRQVSLSHPAWQPDFQKTLPDLSEHDVGGSGFAIADYSVAATLGGNAALARLRARMKRRGLKLMLDFVPNHMGLDHPWVKTHPEFFVAGTEEDREWSPQNYTVVPRRGGDLILAHGRDPYFDGWPDTLQLNYGNAGLQQAMIGELLNIAAICDGVRCDMAMLVLPDVFEHTWHIRSEPFWPAALAAIRDQFPQFTWLAEVYWDREWVLQQQGFDFTYDKRLYDRLHAGPARPVREHFYADLDFQNKAARFLENHDESRAATAFHFEQHRAAAAITYLSPGLRFFQEGQFEGRSYRVSPHLVRAPAEQVIEPLRAFYERLLTATRTTTVREGQWQLLQCVPAWGGNHTWDNFLAFAWTLPNHPTYLVTVNYGPSQGQCYVKLPLEQLRGQSWLLRDLLSEAQYERHGDELLERDLYLDLAPWQYHAFELHAA